TKVRERFDGEKWQLPVMVYSRPLELYPSQRLSQAQMLREWIEREGLGDRITLLLEDYRKLEGTFDKLVSIEMIEA
ncbi:class I SAM-dependent methyltransferase, partial [Aeromonas salmonicida]|uniref:SAM-dependent methyltransferase n=1 Tax=Aeromonas salmonicida TaxID=645 RepID=UPI003D3195BE